MIAMAVDENLRALLMDIRWRRLPGKRQERPALPEQTKRASVSDT